MKKHSTQDFATRGNAKKTRCRWKRPEIEGYLTLAIDNQWIVFGGLMVGALMIFAVAFRTTHLAAVPMLVPIAWIIIAFSIGDTGLVKKQRTYCKNDHGFSHAVIQKWPQKSYAICKDGVGEDWLGPTVYVRERGVWGTPIAKLPQY